MRTPLLAAAALLTSLSAPLHASPTLVELFTSEGCSSCPPADEYLNDLAEAEQKAGDETVLIAWHVDYWDDLGWTDPFALAFATQRQRDYASAMTERRTDGAGVYTPQMIVNGERAFVGSNRRAGKILLRRAHESASLELDLKVALEGDQLTLTAELSELPEGAVVMGVLVEDALSSKVDAGENAGETLEHERVARAAATGEIADGVATVRLTVPEGVDTGNASSVFFVQESGMGKVLGVAEAPLVRTSAPEARYQTLEIGSRTLRYALILPDGFDPNTTYPALLALPPGGQDEAMVEAGLNLYWEAEARRRGWIVVSPINPDFARLFQATSDPLGRLMDDLNERFDIEGDTFHLTGVSNGGRAAFLEALEDPERFVSLTVLPGLMEDHTPVRRIQGLRDIPVAMYAGGDDVAWTAEAERTVEALEAQGVTVSLTVLPGEGHVMQLAPTALFDLLDSYREDG